MRAFVFATAAIFVLPAIAIAQGGGGLPNPAPAPTIEARPPLRDTGSEAVQRSDGALERFNNRTLPSQSNEAEVQTPNSMPRGAAPASTPMARRMESARGEKVAPGRLAPNNGSGISQTTASMPPDAMKGTVPQINADGTAAYLAAQKNRQLAALHNRQAIRLARQHSEANR